MNQIKITFAQGKNKKWYETYWVFDIHDTILRSNHDLNKKLKDEDFYPYAKETLQLLTSMPHVRLIMWTSSYPHEIADIIRLFKENSISFNFFSENPDISSNKGNFGYYEDKFYFNVMFENKAGFDPGEWREIYDYLVEFDTGDYTPDPKWSKY